jgi:hypothetical protein
MAEQLTKLRPDRDLQCYFQQPTAVAALSGTSATGFTVSGSWRQQFDWAVVEWSRDNGFEHPALRNLPDGDLSGVRLSYEETRTGCIQMDSTTYDSIGWSYLRIWEESGGTENFHWVPLKPHATAIAGQTTQPTAVFELQGTPTAGDYVELAWLDQHANYCVGGADTLETITAGLVAFLNQTPDVTAAADGTTITLTYTGMPGANGNRVGVYAGVSGAKTESWSPSSAMFTGGTSPATWKVALDFGNLTDSAGAKVDTTNVRRVRWTWAADWQFGDFARSEFSVAVANWQATGSGLTYQVAGPGSRRIEDTSAAVSYAGSWGEERGNYSGGSIRHTTTPGDRLVCSYTAAGAHSLYLGTRYTGNGGSIAVQVDGGTATTVNLRRQLEDVLLRVPLGQLAAGPHSVSVQHTGGAGTDVYFDFLEAAVPCPDLPDFVAYPTTTLATDWDTEHSLAIAPERTAWLIQKLGFRGRANHYAGALWFYELVNPTATYASATVTFSGAPVFGGTTTLTLAGTPISHLNLISDTAASMAKCFELLITAGTSSVWARANGATLTITARAGGASGNGIAVAASTGSSAFTATVGAPGLAGGSACPTSGGADGTWLTDLAAMPRLNRAARDWHRSYFAALNGYGITATAALSMELGNGDDSAAAGIAQRYPDGPCRVSTPALQTNFSPSSLAFWQQAYRDLADLMNDAGTAPYLQFGEVQWWYFADQAGMPFYDAYTTAQFQSQYGRPMATIASEHADPAQYPDECAFLPRLIGQFTAAVMAFVRQTYPAARFEVLYPPDTNATALDTLINFPAADWTPAALACLKTENFTYTGNRSLDLARASMAVPGAHGFPASQTSHLIGISDYTSPWLREWEIAMAQGLESAVLFALDQFCLIGYGLPLEAVRRRALFMGS